MTDETETVEGKIVSTVPRAALDHPMSGAHSMSISEEEKALIYGGADGADLTDDDPYRRILDQILSAETPDSVLTPVEAKKLGDYVGYPLLLFGFTLQESTYDVGTPFYAALECRDVEANEPVVLTTGHRKVIAQIVRLRQLAEAGKADWPFEVMPRSRGTGQGGTPLLELAKWPEDYVAKSEHEPPPF